MSIQKTFQTGDELTEPVPQSLIELQQIVLGFFLVWDALGDDYLRRETVERTVLANWAAKHRIRHRQSIELLVQAKLRFQHEPWAHFIQCRDFNREGWSNALLFNPKDNQDVLDQVKVILDARPFAPPPPGP